jgi:hypothetical protein
LPDGFRYYGPNGLWNTWNEDQKIGRNTWLFYTERDSHMAAIQTPAPGGPWVDRQRRLGRIAELRDRAASASGPARVEAPAQLEQVENYERPVQLDDWWKRP